MRKSLLDMATLAVIVSAILAAASCAGSDASWDLRNYHLYDGYALLHGRLAIDLAPAQLQTFYVPVLDTAYWLLLGLLNQTPRLLNIILALPQAAAVCLSWAVARCYLTRPEALVATAISATGAAMVPTIASTMSEASMAMLDLAALWLLLRRPAQGLAAGLLAGAAAGLKLTAAPYAIGLLAAGGPKRLPKLAAAVGGGALLCAGWWWFALWHHYGNPVFPYFNDLFHSPWAEASPLTDRRFMPHGLLQTLFYPFVWALAPVTAVSELPIRDPRIALALAATAILGWRAAAGERLRSPLVPIVVFFLVSLALWELQFSIFRYLATLELLSGTLIVLAFRRLSPLLAIAVLASTIYPDWGHATGARAVSVALPPMPENSVVLLLDPSPMAYVAAFAPSGMRFIGASNNLTHPGAHTRLAEEIAAAIRGDTRPLWGLESPADSPGIADATLQAYGLRRAAGCRRVHSNLDGDAVVACPLARQQARSTRVVDQ